MNHIKFSLLSLLTLLITSISAQEPKSITKQEVISAVLQNNHSLKIAEQNLKSSQADYKQSNAVILPNISLSYTGITTTNPLMAFGSKLNQEILTAADFNPTLLNDPTRTNNFATQIEVQQPLINMDGIHMRKAAKAKMEAITAQVTRTNHYLELEVEKAYMQLQLAYKAESVMQNTLKAVLANKQIAENNFKEGYLQKTDLLEVDIKVNEIKNKLQEVKSNLKNASNYLSFLMNDKTNTILLPTDSLTPVIQQDSITVNNERVDIQAMQQASNAYESMYKSSKMAFLPRLNAFGSYQLYDDKILQADANGYLVGAQLSWNILEGSTRFAKVQKSKSEFQKSKLEYEQYKSKSNLEFNQASRKLVDAKNKLAATKLGVTQSQEILQIRKNRFKEGLEKTADLLLAETQYSHKQLEYYQSIFEYNFAYAYLQFLTK